MKHKQTNDKPKTKTKLTVTPKKNRNDAQGCKQKTKQDKGRLPCRSTSPQRQKHIVWPKSGLICQNNKGPLDQRHSKQTQFKTNHDLEHEKEWQGWRSISRISQTFARRTEAAVNANSPTNLEEKFDEASVGSANCLRAKVVTNANFTTLTEQEQEEGWKVVSPKKKSPPKNTEKCSRVATPSRQRTPSALCGSHQLTSAKKGLRCVLTAPSTVLSWADPNEHVSWMWKHNPQKLFHLVSIDNWTCQTLLPKLVHCLELATASASAAVLVQDLESLFKPIDSE